MILREIILEYLEVHKTAILTHFEALNFEFLQFLKAEIFKNNKIQSLYNCKNDSFGTFIFSINDFT